MAFARMTTQMHHFSLLIALCFGIFFASYVVAEEPTSPDTPSVVSTPMQSTSTSQSTEERTSDESTSEEKKPLRHIRTKIYERAPRPITNARRSQPLQPLYDDPNQPAVVRKTQRHPDADKLEIDFD